MVKPRSVFMAIIFSRIPIYDIYWFVKLTNEMNVVTNHKNDTSGGTAFFLSLITLGVYGFYWGYRMGVKLDRFENKRSLRRVGYMLFGPLGFGLITRAFLQNELNKIIEKNERFPLF